MYENTDSFKMTTKKKNNYYNGMEIRIFEDIYLFWTVLNIEFELEYPLKKL